MSTFNAIAQEKCAPDNDFERIIFEAGMLYPIGKLQEKIAPMPNLGLWYRSQIRKDLFMDVGFNVSIINGLQTFDIERNDSIFKSKPRGLGGMVGFRFSKIYRLSQRANFEWCPSIGFAFLPYRANFIGFSNTNDTRSINPEQKTKALLGMHLGQGIRLNYDDVGFQVQYQFTPFSVFTKDIAHDFGNQSFVFGVVYRQ